MRTIVLLGSQRLQPTLAEAVRAVGVRGPVAAVTAGWEERENEIDELSEHLARPVVNLHLHDRGEDVFRRDPELFAAWQERRTRLRELQDIHLLRLDHKMHALRDLRKRHGREELLAPERRDAMDEVRHIDAHHLARVGAIHAEWEARWRPAERDSLAGHRRELELMAAEVGSLAVAGGNVAVLINRLRLFGVMDIFREHTVFAWSAGAMTMTERIVIYHDDPPWGRGNPIILGPGFGVCPGIVALPHAHRRLRLDRPSRLRLWNERFAPLACVALEDGAWIVQRDGQYVAQSGGVRQFGADGHLKEFLAA